MQPFTKAERVLSIQSHVVSGFAGNKAATFPLQYLGFQVDAVNTVNFSNHTGYGHTNGHKTTAEQLNLIFSGLNDNGLLVPYPRILTGYVPGAEALQCVADQLAEVRRCNPGCVYLLDPVMGDIGRGLYVAEQVIPIYKSMLPLATIITPNHFELELLSDMKITSPSSLQQAIRHLHEKYSLTHVVVSSISLPSSLVSRFDLPGPPDSYQSLLGATTPSRYTGAQDFSTSEGTNLVCLASTYRAEGRQLVTSAYALPNVEAYFAGVGDLFSSMVMAHFGNLSGASEQDLQTAVSKALLIVQRILLRSHMHSMQVDGDASPGENVMPSDTEADNENPRRQGNPSRRARRMRLRELRIIEDRSLLRVASDDGWNGGRVNLELPELDTYHF
ncbi:Ribokinase-like protein [Kockovaella imperatae]|uniref:pyridoxal kinase n=1 Tax=Kockovaella imperatae TaxID=4999 RepID=A0A1Y1UCJ0_9TREE|nr:Ribokinase-like protein [Kockovaella imperatae]ORX35763.1 Ribokinase-like protein [Kockovaella imperatae]